MIFRKYERFRELIQDKPTHHRYSEKCLCYNSNGVNISSKNISSELSCQWQYSETLERTQKNEKQFIKWCFMKTLTLPEKKLAINNISAITIRNVSCSVMPNSLQSHILYPTRLLCPWTSPGKNTKVGSHPFSRESSQLRDWTQVFCIASRFFTIWATRGAQKLLERNYNNTVGRNICMKPINSRR